MVPRGCTLGLGELADSLDRPDREFLARIRIIDSVRFAETKLIPSLNITARLERVVLHPPVPWRTSVSSKRCDR